MKYNCEYEGKCKVVYGYDSKCTKLYCLGHAEDWKRQFGGEIVYPRKVFDTIYECEGDWLLPGMIP